MRNEALTHMIDAVTHGQQPQPRILRELLNDHALRRRWLEQPAIADTLAQAATLRSGIGCPDVGDELPVLIDAARGEAVPEFLASAYLHIQRCPWCMDVYSLTRSLAQAQPRAEPARPLQSTQTGRTKSRWLICSSMVQGCSPICPNLLCVAYKCCNCDCASAWGPCTATGRSFGIASGNSSSTKRRRGYR